jgi:hypothetical protein
MHSVLIWVHCFTYTLAGPLDFHRNSLLNLSEAMRRTRRLCATVIDTMGRELMIRGQWQVNDQVNGSWVVMWTAVAE